MERLEERFRLGQLIGASGAFLTEARKIPMIARSRSCVLISGEPGTGKETCARAIHEMSDQGNEPFVTVCCGALPRDGAEAVLFGSVLARCQREGIWTGGAYQDAAGGTLFIDEIDHLPPTAQVGLLQIIRAGRVSGSGHNGSVLPCPRVIAAVARSPWDTVREGMLRQDLYAQLNVLSIRMPPLRERREDVILLAAHFMRRFGRDMGRLPLRFSDGAVRKLLASDWPGNVRELEQVVERAVTLCESEQISDRDIVFDAGEPGIAVESFRDAKARFVEEFERRYIAKLLLLYRGNISRAARAAQKDRRAFWELMRKHGIDAERYRILGHPSLDDVI